jgi:hypothetical protein
MGRATVIRGWVPEARLREYLDSLVWLAGVEGTNFADDRLRNGHVWLDGKRLDEACWQRVAALVEQTGVATGMWMGFAWANPLGIQVRLQRDDWRGPYSKGNVRARVRTRAGGPAVGQIRALFASVGGANDNEAGSAES